jgi:hypothetical protein
MPTKLTYNLFRIIFKKQETEEERKARVEKEIIEFNLELEAANKELAEPDTSEWMAQMATRKNEDGTVGGFTFEEFRAFLRQKEANREQPNPKRIRRSRRLKEREG